MIKIGKRENKKKIRIILLILYECNKGDLNLNVWKVLDKLLNIGLKFLG